VCVKIQKKTRKRFRSHFRPVLVGDKKNDPSRRQAGTSDIPKTEISHRKFLPLDRFWPIFRQIHRKFLPLDRFFHISR
jgi:hypothetical protein